MGFWNRDLNQPSVFDTADDLANLPAGGPLRQWLLGVGLALLPVGYGIHCLRSGIAAFFDDSGNALNVRGPAAAALAVAYVAIGIFIHIHWFWGLHPRLYRFSALLKLVTLLIFLGSYGYGVWYLLRWL